MAKKRIKQLNYGHLLEKEDEIKGITLDTYKKPFVVIDNSIKHLLNVLDFSLKTYEKTSSRELKNYCDYFLKTGNSVLHITRSSKILLLSGYYGSIAVLFRTYLNYLILGMYVSHYPNDLELLLNESETDFSESKEFRKKFHEKGLRTELERLGHNLPDDGSFAKITHGSVWASQVFGSKTISMNDDVYELNYSPRFSLTQLYVYSSLLLAMPLDFSRYFLDYLKRNNIEGAKKLIEEFDCLEDEVSHAENAMKSSFEIMKETPPEELEKLLENIKK